MDRYPLYRPPPRFDAHAVFTILGLTGLIFTAILTVLS